MGRPKAQTSSEAILELRRDVMVLSSEFPAVIMTNTSMFSVISGFVVNFQPNNLKIAEISKWSDIPELEAARQLTLIGEILRYFFKFYN